MTPPSDELGYIDSAQQLATAERSWSPRQLLEAATRAELRHTGWPIGVVLSTPEYAPMPTEDGVEFKKRWPNHESESWEDYWHFRVDGRYFVSRLFEEDRYPASFQSGDGHPERPFWFDTRIWRIAEVVLHSAKLYASLGIPPSERYRLSVKHLGLDGREFWKSDAGRFLRRGRFCRAKRSSWEREVTQDLVVADLPALVFEISEPLFALFAFMEISESVVQEIVAQFLRSRV
ncbi:MAG: hypothetical protein AB7T37_06170 [Dehalococcoidia bacterium]